MNEEQIFEIVQDYAVPAVTVVLIILIAFLVASWTGRIVRGACEKARVEATLAKFFGRAARWTVLLIAALFCLSKFGIETSSFAVVLGSIGLAVGLAMQGTLSNIAAGVMLLIFRPFKVGDAITVAGQTGKVDEIELFTTTLNTFDNRRLILPNSSVFGSTIENITYHVSRRAEVAVGVDYGADIDQTRRVLEQAVASVEGRLDDPAPQVVLMELGGSSVDWVVRVWAPTPDMFTIRERTIRAVKKALDEAEISIPFPQMDVHLDGQLAGAPA